MDINEEVENESIQELECILRKWENDDTLALSQIECLPGSRQGDNYMSIIKRVKVEGKWKNNENDYRNSLIIKRQILSRSRRQLYRCDEAFNNEIAAYCHLIPVLNSFSQDALPFPRCIFAGIDKADAAEAIILEDLVDKGYHMADRMQGLDYNSCSVVLQKLGHFHGISLAMKCLNSTAFHNARRPVEEIVFCSEASAFYSYQLESSISEALSSLRSSNLHNELDIPIKCMEKLSGKLYNIMAECISNKNNDMWKVICHGDLWINNLMFEKNSKNYVTDVKIVDLQTIRYASLVIDIIQFLYSSTNREIRSQFFNQLISDYRKGLIESLKQYMLPNNMIEFQKLENEFTVSNIIKEFKKNALYGIGTTIWLLPAVTFHPDRTPDLDSVKFNDFTNCTHELNVIQLHTPEYHKRLKEVFMEYYERGFLNDIINMLD